MTLALLLVAACAPPAATPDSADPGLPGLATVEGVITRSADVQGDGVGTLLVGLFFDPIGDPLPVPLWGWSRNDVDVNADDFSIPYQLTNVFPQDEPYYIAAIFDEDTDIVLGPDLYPSQGDLMSIAFEAGGIPPMVIDTDGTHALDLDLGAINAIDWGPPEGGSDGGGTGGSGSGGGASGGSGSTGGNTGDGTIEVAIRSSLDASDDLVGDVHVWLFEGDPRTDPQPPLYQGDGVPVDLTTAGAEATFTLDNVPIRAEAMSVVAYLDVDGSGANGPTSGDPVALDGTDLPTVLVEDEMPASLALELSGRSD